MVSSFHRRSGNAEFSNPFHIMLPTILVRRNLTFYDRVAKFSS
jgi:hypothetical protein